MIDKPDSGSKTVWQTSRRVLQRLQQLMAGTHNDQALLNNIVSLISNELSVDVCSLYLMNAQSRLELMASVGLNSTAVHKTVLKLDEGLIGYIASTQAPFYTADAASHPQFLYRVETGEESFQSLAGVPLMRAGQCLGVLAVQTRVRHNFHPDIIELLQTIAMVLSEFTVSARLLQNHVTVSNISKTFQGSSLSPGLAVGQVWHHDLWQTDAAAVSHMPDKEHDRFNNALLSVSADLTQQIKSEQNAATKDILQACTALMSDTAWQKQVHHFLDAGLTAEAAIASSVNALRQKLSHNLAWQEKLWDVEALATRLWRALNPNQPRHFPLKPYILIAKRLGAVELMEYPPDNLQGIILEEGGATSHVAVLARALGVPCIGNAVGAYGGLAESEMTAMNANTGKIWRDPEESILRPIQQTITAQAKADLKEGVDYCNLPPKTLDNVRIQLMMNVGLPQDAKKIALCGADGIGLVRSELAFLLDRTLPDQARQVACYREILNEADGKPVYFRLLDIGADKQLSFVPMMVEQNPALGLRGLQLLLQNPIMLRQQIAAIIQAHDGKPAYILLPMVRSTHELAEVRKIIDTFDAPVKLGVMIEVPALIFQLPQVLGMVDFINIGTNDLLQYASASSRDSACQPFYPLSPANLSMLQHIYQHTKDSDIPVTVCGEMTGTPLGAMALMGIGYTALSMPPRRMPQVRNLIQSLDISLLSPFIERLIKRKDVSISEQLSFYARDHRVIVPQNF